MPCAGVLEFAGHLKAQAYCPGAGLDGALPSGLSLGVEDGRTEGLVPRAMNYPGSVFDFHSSLFRMPWEQPVYSYQPAPQESSTV